MLEFLSISRIIHMHFAEDTIYKVVLVILFYCLMKTNQVTSRYFQ